MIKNSFDYRVKAIFVEHEGDNEAQLEAWKALTESLAEELKAAWKGSRTADQLARSMIDECLAFTNRELDEWDEWDEGASDQLLQLFAMANQTRQLREAVGWAAASRDLETRQLLKKMEGEAEMIFVLDSLEYLDGVAFRLLTWLNARNLLLVAYRNR